MERSESGLTERDFRQYPALQGLNGYTIGYTRRCSDDYSDKACQIPHGYIAIAQEGRGYWHLRRKLLRDPLRVSANPIVILQSEQPAKLIEAEVSARSRSKRHQWPDDAEYRRMWTLMWRLAFSADMRQGERFTLTPVRAGDPQRVHGMMVMRELQRYKAGSIIHGSRQQDKWAAGRNLARLRGKPGPIAGWSWLTLPAKVVRSTGLLQTGCCATRMGRSGGCMTYATGRARMHSCSARRTGSVVRFKCPQALLRSSGAWTSGTESAPIRGGRWSLGCLRAVSRRRPGVARSRGAVARPCRRRPAGPRSSQAARG